MAEPSPQMPAPVLVPDSVSAPPPSVNPQGQSGSGEAEAGKPEVRETVEQPAKVMRIGSMIKQLLEEVRQAPLDEASRTRLQEVYATSVRELAEGLSPDLRDELNRLSSPFADDGTPPSDAELRVAHSQIVGWLEGLFHGIQFTLLTQQMGARGQLEQMRQQALNPGGPAADASSRPGTYL